MKSIIILLLTAWVAVSINADDFFPSKSNIVELNEGNFNSLVLKSDAVWIVQFYDPLSENCQNLKPKFIKVARAFKGVIKVGAVNCLHENAIQQKYGVKVHPTIKIFGINKIVPEDCLYKNSTRAIVDAGLAAVQELVNHQGSNAPIHFDNIPSKEIKSVTLLSEANFNELVEDSDDFWLVGFYVPWCVPCKTLAPKWATAATALKGKAKFGALDANNYTSLAEKYYIDNFPAIIAFPPGMKDPNKVIEYFGGSETHDLVNWTLTKLNEYKKINQTFNELVDEAIFNNACNKHRICIIYFLPTLKDCNDECRQVYLDFLKRLCDNYKKKVWGWIWTEAGKQPLLEKTLGVDKNDYPTAVMINEGKRTFGALRGKFTYEGVKMFLRDVSLGRVATRLKGKGVPPIAPYKPWEGKDMEHDVKNITAKDLGTGGTKDEL